MFLREVTHIKISDHRCGTEIAKNAALIAKKQRIRAGQLANENFTLIFTKKKTPKPKAFANLTSFNDLRDYVRKKKTRQKVTYIPKIKAFLWFFNMISIFTVFTKRFWFSGTKQSNHFLFK